MTASRRIARLPRAEVFAVEDDRAQLVWRGAHAVTVAVDGDERPDRHGPGPAVIEVDGLEPDRLHELTLRCGRDRYRLGARTVERPAGRPLARVATIGDLHFGARRFGLVRPPGDPVGTELEARHPQRCARDAVAAALRWGAEVLVVKGDCTEHGRPIEWESFGRFLDEVPIPVLVTPGNHDVTGLPDALRFADGMASIGRPVTPVHHLDTVGVRIIVADTTVAGRGRGTLARVGAEVVERAATADGPVLVAMHHHLHDVRLPIMWPIGVLRPEARRFLTDLRRANPAVFVTSGHSHRNRRLRHGNVAVTEVGSVKDYPGNWAGYAVHEGGIRQVLRRLTGPDAFGWTERAAHAVGGIWAHWSPGTIDQRCFTHEWADVASRRPLTSEGGRRT